MFKKKQKIFKLNDESITFIKIYAIPYLGITTSIDNDILTDIIHLAEEWELEMIDESGQDKQFNYPQKTQNEQADKFVSDVSGKWSKGDIDFNDLNLRLNMINKQ